MSQRVPLVLDQYAWCKWYWLSHRHLINLAQLMIGSCFWKRLVTIFGRNIMARGGFSDTIMTDKYSNLHLVSLLWKIKLSHLQDYNYLYKWPHLEKSIVVLPLLFIIICAAALFLDNIMIGWRVTFTPTNDSLILGFFILSLFVVVTESAPAFPPLLFYSSSSSKEVGSSPAPSAV